MRVPSGVPTKNPGALGTAVSRLEEFPVGARFQVVMASFGAIHSSATRFDSSSLVQFVSHLLRPASAQRSRAPHSSSRQSTRVTAAGTPRTNAMKSVGAGS